MELDTCVRAIERRPNVVYHMNFVRQLKARLRRMARAWPGAFDLSQLRRVWTIRRFDELYTAPFHGFAGASDYYHRASAMRVADRIAVPTLIVAAQDDPVVPPEQFLEPAVRDNPNVVTRLERHGGHCGFIGEPAHASDGYWAEDQAVGFLDAVIRRSALAPAAAR
jgi:predicted alpha/beta-fold hydrolase